MSILLSTFYSNDEMRTSLVYLVEERQYEVITMDSYNGREKITKFESRQQAEDFAEDWVL